MTKLQDLKLFITPEHPCSYLDDQQATTLFADPNTLNNHLYGQLTQIGFRRSGEHVYRPHCQQCNACIPTRIPVDVFTPSRQQKRVWTKNKDVLINKISGSASTEHYELYEKYISTRHRDGDMYPPSEQQFHSFLFSSWSATQCYEFRAALDNHLLAVAVLDQIELGLSAVYTFFDPREEKRSLGVYALLWEIELAKLLGLPYLYLGYWIKECKKMSYKGNYRPLEVFINDQWLTLL